MQKPSLITKSSRCSQLTRQLDILLLYEDHVAILAELRLVEVSDRHALLREADELGAVKPRGVGKHPATVNDRDRLVAA